jgi:hypothetical protein
MSLWLSLLTGVENSIYGGKGRVASEIRKGEGEVEEKGRKTYNPLLISH